MNERGYYPERVVVGHGRAVDHCERSSGDRTVSSASGDGLQDALFETQQLIAASAKWGWIRAGRDPAELPSPFVTWDKSGAKIVGTRRVNPSDTVIYAAGSFIHPNTGKPNTTTCSMTVRDVDPLRDSRDE